MTFEDAGLKLLSNIVKRFPKVENQLVCVPERGLEMKMGKFLMLALDEMYISFGNKMSNQRLNNICHLDEGPVGDTSVSRD